MSQPFLGLIMLVGFNFAPFGWADCDGRSLPISQNDALFTLLGTTFGGDGINTFNLPDLRGRTPIGSGQGGGLTDHILGEVGGVESVTLTSSQGPLHNHSFLGDAEDGNTAKVNGNLLAQGYNIYRAPSTIVANFANGTSVVGGSQPHDNLQPYLAMKWVISLEGIFPPPS
jgi:microcystin-dependent protein